jgi:diguanylate cyclase (GGDEF)-like protein
MIRFPALDILRGRTRKPTGQSSEVPNDMSQEFKQSNTRHAPIDLGATVHLEQQNNALPGPVAAKAFLNVIRSKADLGVHAFVDGPTLLGRDPSCTIPLHDFGVSKQHAIIRPAGNGIYILQDLQSTNGTSVNGTPVPGTRILQDGEKIFLGETVIRFQLADEMDVDFHSEVATLVSTDPLTGLPSKRRFDQALDFALQSAKQNNSPLALLMMDMDGVKQINDTHGHLFGAHVIGETGRLIDRVIGFKGEACRFGGDEFSAFLPASDLETAKLMAEKIRVAVETAGFQKEGIDLKPTISIGLACYPDAGDEMLTLVDLADKALYRAKEQGKNRVAV